MTNVFYYILTAIIIAIYILPLILAIVCWNAYYLGLFAIWYFIASPVVSIILRLVKSFHDDFNT